MRWIARHIRDNLVGYLALVIALGGTSYAVAALADGSVGTRHLKNSAVTTKKIKNKAVTKAKVKPGVVPFTRSKLTSVAFADEVLPDPVPAPDDVSLYHPLNLRMPFRGKVTAFATIASLGQNCSAGDAQAGLYVDGSPVAGTRQNVLPQASAQSIAFIATVPLAKGNHVVNLGIDCPDGTLSSATYGKLVWSVTAAK